MMLKKNSFSFILFILILFNFTLVAHANHVNNSYYNPYYFISLSAGPGWTHAGKTQTIALESDVIKTYAPNNLTNSHVLLNGELFLGIQHSFFPCIQSQFGVAIYASSPAKLNGYIQEDGDPNFENFTYNYKIDHEHIALKTKWIAENAFSLNPYLSVSLGLGFNHSYDFSINPLLSQEIPAPSFSSHTMLAFSYTVGAGFQHTINQHFTIGLGYELVSWGESSLNRAQGQTSGHGLRLSSLYTQNLEFNLTYRL